MIGHSKLLAVFTLIFCFPTTLFAVGSGGYANQVPHARAMGRANSVVASVDDSSAVSFNAARLTAINRFDVSLGFTTQSFDTEYTSSAGQSDSSVSDIAITPNFHLGMKVPDGRAAFGLGVNIPHGLTTEWSKDSQLRYIATKSELAILDVSPSVGYEITEQLSVGMGVNYYSVTKATFDRQLNVAALNTALGGGAGEPDGTQRLDADGDDLGANVGAAYKLSDKHLFGVSYRTGANIAVEGTVKLDGLSNESAFVFGPTYETGAKSTVVVPPELQMGYAYRPAENTTIEFDVQWNRWGRFQDQNVSFSEADATRLAILTSDNPTPKNWRNAWSFGLGSEFKISELFSARAGYAFFDSPVPNSSFEASTPDSDLHAFTLGLGVGTDAIAIDFAAQYFKLNDRHISNNVGASLGTTGDGKYETDAIYLALNFSLRR